MTVRLLALLALGLLLRVFVSAIYLPQSGFRIDISAYTAWAQRMVALGPGGFYEPGYFADYPPGYLYVLWLLGGIGAALEPVVGIDITWGLVKVPGILADVGVAAMLFVLARRFLSERAGIVAAAIYLFSPGPIFNASVWGQIDSVGALVLLVTIYLLLRGWTELAAVGAVLALLVKFQFAFLIPVVALVGIKRHLVGRSSDPSMSGQREPMRVANSLLAGLATLLLLIAPFRMAIWSPGEPHQSLIGKFFEAAGTYTGLSVNAFNLWRNPLSGLGSSFAWGDDRGTVVMLGELAITWQAVGALLFAAVAVVALVQAWRRDDATGVLVASLLLAIAFFALPTRVHERYLFPALALAAPLAAHYGRRWIALYVALGVSFFMNVYWTYTLDWSFAGDPPLNPGLGGAPMQRDALLDATLLSDAGVWFLSATIVVALGWVLVRSVELIRIGDGRIPAADVPAAGVPAIMPGRAPAAPPATPAAARAGPAPPSEVPPRPSATDWLATPERPRRLDRLDLALLIAVVLFALVFRVWRLDVPRAVHFDEVYHARSAVEWLANWRHPWSRDVYEWTHPMLGKYLIAAGIVVADPNRVVDSEPTSVPSRGLAVAVARSAQGIARSVAFVGEGDTIVARDVRSGEQVASWSAGGDVASLAYDPRGPVLFVGLSSRGTLVTHDLAAFLAAGGPRAPPPVSAEIATPLDAIVEIVPSPDGSAAVARGPERVAVVDRMSGELIGEAAVAAGGIAYLPDAGSPDADGEEAAPAAQLALTDPQRQAVGLLDATTLAEVGVIELTGPPVGPLTLRGSGRQATLFVPLGPLSATDEHDAAPGGLAVLDPGERRIIETVPLPGTPRSIAWQHVADMIYVAGDGPEASELWTVSPHGDDRSGFAAFDTTPLSGEPLAMAVDASEHRLTDDNGRLLVATASAEGGRLLSIDAGANAFAWRLAGVVFGALLAGLIYLLAATMFVRRRIAVLAAAFVAFDLMSYAQSRIAMNDIFVAFFIVAAYLVFWQVWSGRWARSAWWALPLTGALIGLAAASKWVGFYALAGLLVLVLVRSDLGRLILLGGAAFVLVVAGLGAPWGFLLVLLGTVGLLLFLAYRRPPRLSRDDLPALPASGLVLGGVGLAFALAYPTIAGREPRSAVELVFSFLARGVEAGWPLWVMIGVAAALIAARAARSLTAPASERRWFAPDALGGFAWPWAGACLIIVPLVVYGLTYLPYTALGNSWSGPSGGPGYGWAVDELHSQMFGYHFRLEAAHAASSPWWSWPLSLKPVWFFQDVFPDDGTTAVIYNGGNPLLFWAGLPAVALAGFVAGRHRSLALLLIVIAFALQWLPWTRIERATFAYHYFTALPFAMLALAWLTDAALRQRAGSTLAAALLGLAVLAGLLIFPLASALPMPDWYINAARALPPWNYYFTFPDPAPQAGDLVGAGPIQLLGGLAAAGAAVLFALFGADRWRDWRASRAALRTDPEADLPS